MQHHTIVHLNTHIPAHPPTVVWHAQSRRHNLWLSKTSKDRAKEPDVDALERVIMLDLDVHICLWRGSDGTESEVAVKKALCVISDRFPGNPGNKKGELGGRGREGFQTVGWFNLIRKVCDS